MDGRRRFSESQNFFFLPTASARAAFHSAPPPTVVRLRVPQHVSNKARHAVTLDIAIVLIILAIALVLFVSEVLRMDLVALLVLCALTITQVVTPNEAICCRVLSRSSGLRARRFANLRAR